MENLAFTPYIKRGGSDHTRLPLSHAHPYPQRTLPLQPIRNPRASHGPVKVVTSSNRAIKPPRQATAIYTAASMEEAHAYFKEIVDRPEHIYLPSHPGTQQTYSLHMLPANFSFRPLGGYQQTYEDARTQMKFKVEESPTLPTPAVLPGSVDASQYESIPYSEWLQASTEYQSLSPSSLESHTDSVATPGDWEPDHSLARSAFASMQSEAPLYNNFWMAQAQQLPTYIDHGLPSPAQGSSFSHSELSQEDSQHVDPHPLRIYTAVPQDLSLASSSSSSNNDKDNGTQPSEQDPDSDTEDEADVHRREQDDFLVRMREEGFKYGEIKRRGKFREAESTLRGRYRALTKDKLERLRSPQWQDHDIILLRQAVKRYTNGNVTKLKTRNGGKKVPWKKIGEWVKDHGGSYLFSPATCAKKWESIKRLPPPQPPHAVVGAASEDLET